MAVVCLYGGEEGRRPEWPSVKPLPEMKQQRIAGKANVALCLLQDLKYKI